MFEVTLFQCDFRVFCTLFQYKGTIKRMNPPAFHNGGGFWFLVWNESGLRPDPGPDVMLLKITLRQLLRKSREPA